MGGTGVMAGWEPINTAPRGGIVVVRALSQIPGPSGSFGYGEPFQVRTARHDGRGWLACPPASPWLPGSETAAAAAA